MPKIAIPGNLSDVETGFKALPADSYRVRIAAVEQKTSQTSGQPYLKFQLEVSDGEYQGRKLFANASLQSHALFTLKAILEACGAGWEEDGIDTEDILGREMLVEVNISDYNGKETNEVTKFAAL